MKQHFLLQPEITYLNFGSFGACPKPVFQRYQQFQLELEQEPVQFMMYHGPKYLHESRVALAQYVHCDADNLVFVTNPSYAINIIAKSLNLQPGDEILSTNLEYGAVDRTWRFCCTQTGARYVQQPISLPVQSEADIVDALFQGVTDRTRVICISHITSATALILPVEEICARAKAMGLITIVDGAHAPGHVPLHLNTLQADYYTGACHKWMCTPKGCSFLYAAKNAQQILQPLVVSWGYEAADPSASQFQDYHQMQGTRDYSAFLTIPSALQFFEAHHWDAQAKQCRKMVQDWYPELCAMVGAEPLSPVHDSFLGQMASIPIHTASAAALQQLLFNQYRIEIPVTQAGERTFIRFSIQAFNTADDLVKLQRAIEDLMASGVITKRA
ncbi:MAG: aminotransferase class V-fold PLP-dependent enzyme [Chitinophagales bacterium]